MYAFAETQRDGGVDASRPLIFTFHGTGGTEQQFHTWAEKLLPDATVISPRGDVSEGGALRFFKRRGEGNYDMEDLAARTAAMAAFMAEQIERLKPSQVLALGYSNGANILASVMLGQPGLVDKAALMHPLIPWTPEPQPGLEGRAVLVTAGTNDPICPPNFSEALIQYFEANGVAVEKHWFDSGHGVSQDEANTVSAFISA